MDVSLVLVLLCCGLLDSSALDLCPEFCTCRSFFHLNCSSAGLSLTPSKIKPSVTELDLSHNQLGLRSVTFKSKYSSLEKVWLGNNSVAQLSLCVNVDLKGQSRWRRRQGCQLWAPALRLLSAENNQLQKVPDGLGQQRSLQILNLSFNKISALEQRDFSHLKLLEELHLQHNLLTHLPPQIFKTLNRLKVLDLRFNLLTTLHPVTYISLHHVGADVGLRGNSWICDCGLRFLQRRMIHDGKSLEMWSVDCASPSALSGTSLRELDRDDLECQDPDVQQEVTVRRGSEIQLTCSEPDAAWWTPNGETTRSREQGRLLVTNITERDEGLYVCLSKSQQILSIFNLQIHERNRKTRSVPNENVPSTLDKMVQARNTVPQSRFALAVSLSVIITFIVAFILGVLLQPYICICWKKIRTKKRKPQTNPVPDTQPGQYDNDAFQHCEVVDDFEPYRERRVTFTEYTEEGNMQYYDAGAGQEGNGQAHLHCSDDSSGKDGKLNHINVNKSAKKIEFETIPDSLERNRSRSSTGDKMFEENCSTPNTTITIEEQIQKTTIDVPQVSNVPGFISEPFADWSPHGNDVRFVEPDLDYGEQFEYSDSVRSGSPMSPNSSFKQQNLPNVSKNNSVKSSSSSSEVSDGEPTHYTVNPDSDEETHISEQRVSRKSSSSSIDSGKESHRAVETWPVIDLEYIPALKRRLMFRTFFVDSFNNTDVTMKNELHQTQPPSIKKRKAPLPPPRKSLSSGSERGKVQLETNHDLKVEHLEQESSWPVVQGASKVKRRLDFKVQNAAWESFSGSDGQEERIYEEIKEQIPIYAPQESEMKHASGTTSSSESDDEQGMEEENVQHLIAPNEQPVVKLEQESQLPVTNLSNIPKIKQRLEIKEMTNEKVMYVHEERPSAVIKVPQQESGTSSTSESEDEVQENYYENIKPATSQNNQHIVTLEQESQWPVVELEKIPEVKRRLDLKISEPAVDAASRSNSEAEQVYVNALKPGSGTSSSNESDDNQEIIQQATSPIKPSTVKPDSESQWPLIDLARLPKVKRRLDIIERQDVKKVVPERTQSEIAVMPQPESWASSSSESDDEQEIQIKQQQEKIHMVTSPSVQTTETQWPGINLIKIPEVKRRLDIRKRVTDGSESSNVSKQYSGPSSSSDSEAEPDVTVSHYENIHQVTYPPKHSEPESQWPLIDLARLPKVKRRLDIIERRDVQKVVPERTQSEIAVMPQPESWASSSSESEDEQEIQIKQQQEEIHMVTSPSVQTTETQWPGINLIKIPEVKRRLDIRKRVTEGSESSNVSKQYSGPSSSNDSEAEPDVNVSHYENIHQVTYPPKHSEPESQWPVVNLVKLPKLKRRLDVKTTTPDVSFTERVPSTAPKSEFETFSSSESEDEQVKLNRVNLQQATSPMTPATAIKLNQEPQWPVVDLVKVHKVKRRLDIKTVSAVELSSSSDADYAREPGRVPSTPGKVQKHTSSSSESEDEQEIKRVTMEKDNLHQMAASTKQPAQQHESKWPEINLVKIPKVRRRLDIKSVKASSKVSEQYSGSSSSCENEEQDVNMNHYENILQVTSPTKKIEPTSQWPVINLVELPKPKRRLDIITKPDREDERVKVPSRPIHVKPDSGASSSSESEDENKIRETKGGNVLATSQYKQPIESKWPVIDLVKIPKVKRRLDIKERVTVRAAQVQERVPPTSIRIPKQHSSGSESDSEEKVVLPTRPPTVEPQWPMIDLVRMPKVKRRLDIKERVKVIQAPSTTVNLPQLITFSSSESEDEEIKVKINQESLQQTVTLPTKQPAESQWPEINLIKVPTVKQRLDIKTTVPEMNDGMTLVEGRVPSTNITLGTSYSSESDDETVQKVGVTIHGSKVEPQAQWPAVDLRGITQIKRRLDFKLTSQSPPLSIPASGGSSHYLVSSSSGSSDEDENVVESLQISSGQTTRWPSQTRLVMPHVSRRLDIKGPSMEPGLQDSDLSFFSSGSLTSQGDRDLIKVSPLLTITHSPTKTTPEIQLEKYTVVTGDWRGTSGSTSPAVTPELQSKWATMNLGHSRFRKRLEISKTSDTPPLPSSPPPSSPKQDQFMAGMMEQVTIAPIREQNVDNSASSESEHDAKLDSKSPISELDSLSGLVNLTGVPHVKRALNVTTMQKKYSSSSDEDPMGIRLPDLSLGVPRIKRRLNIKAPTPPPSSSNSDDEKVYAHRFSDVTDQRSIEYKRTIMKSYSDSHNTNREMYRESLYVQSNPQTPKKLSLDNIKRKLMPSKQNELPPNLRWTSVGGHLSEHPLPTPKRHQDGLTSPTYMSSPPLIPENNVSDSSRSEDKQKEVETTSIVTKKTYNPRGVTFNTSPTILNAATFEDGTERRGLRAIKAMSSDRKNWDSEYETFTESAPVAVDPEYHTVYRRTANVKMSQPLTYSTSSPTLDERRRADMLYGIPSYKTHAVKSTELAPEGPPPPLPTTPLPEDGPDFSWTSLRTGLSRESVSYVQKKTAEEESVDDPFYDNPNISAV